jgi:hypothetical protein
MPVKACALGLTSKERLMPNMQWIAVDAIKPNPRNARTHSKKQIRQIADSITAFGFLSRSWSTKAAWSLPATPVMRRQSCSVCKKSP